MPQLSVSSPTQVGSATSAISLGEIGVAGRGILDGEQLVGEAVEVVDRLRSRSSRSRPTR